MDVLTSIPYKIKKKTKDNQPFNFKKLIDMDRWKT
jgi:hypothetical protein